jgi:hypothetical protein
MAHDPLGKMLGFARLEMLTIANTLSRKMTTFVNNPLGKGSTFFNTS